MYPFDHFLFATVTAAAAAAAVKSIQHNVMSLTALTVLNGISILVIKSRKPRTGVIPKIYPYCLVATYPIPGGVVKA
jgi:hypothetical protein